MAKPRVPRLKDVAIHAHVSLSAASRILRGERQRFGEETCKRVLAAARELGWRRNLLVSGMQTGRTRTIGVMVPPYDSFWVDALAGIHYGLAQADHLPITVWGGDCQGMSRFEQDELEGFNLINRLLDHRVDGLILWPSFAVTYENHFRELVEHRVPVVTINHKSAEIQLADSIETDEAASAQAVAEHLIGLGHRRIACLSSRAAASQTWSVRHRECFEQAVAALEGEVQCWSMNPQGTDGLEVAREILSQQPRPTAIFAVTDHPALFVYEAAAEMGLQMPRDLSIVGFADLDFAARLRPPLTTMRQQPHEIGRRAAQLMIDRLDGDMIDAPPTTIRVGAELIVRQSTGRVAEEEAS